VNFPVNAALHVPANCRIENHLPFGRYLDRGVQPFQTGIVHQVGKRQRAVAAVALENDVPGGDQQDLSVILDRERLGDHRSRIVSGQVSEVGAGARSIGNRVSSVSRCPITCGPILDVCDGRRGVGTGHGLGGARGEQE